MARRLDAATREARGMPQLSEQAAIGLDAAYEVQRLGIGLRVARGERRIGMKMGFTSRAKMAQMGLSDLIWGRLTDAMLVEEGASIRRPGYVHPRVEPEVAFLMKKRLAGNVSMLEAAAALEAVSVAMEIIDSRYLDFKFSLADVVADNCSAAGLVLGSWHRPDTDLANLGLVMSVNGTPVQVGSTAGILGHPLRSLVAAARMTAAAGEALEPGDIVMAGGITAAEALAPGSWIETEMQSLGRVAFGVAPERG